VNWRRALFDNLGFKLAALVIVALLWVSVTADERQAQPVPTRVAYEVSDSAWVLVQGPAFVSTTFQGRNRELLGLLMDEPVVTVQIDSVEGPDMSFQLPLDQVVYDRDLGVVPSFITPGELSLRFERRESARIAVTPDVEAIPAAGFTVLTPILVQPESVTVRGPASWLEGLTRISTRRVQLDAVSNTVLRDVGLSVPANVQGVEIDPPSVLVTVNLDSLIVSSRRVPLRLAGPGAAAAVAEVDSVNVVVRGAATRVSARLDAIEEVVLELSTTPEGPESHALSVALRGDGPIAGSVEPETVTVRPRP
jgi:YbbR domain-containing protein